MLKVEVDVMSGRPNPQWLVTREEAVENLLRGAAEAPEAIGKIGDGYDGLGFREVRVSVMGDDPPTQQRLRLPREFALASTSVGDLRTSGDLARRLIEDMPRRTEVRLLAHELTPLTPKLREGLLERLARFLDRPPEFVRPKRPSGNPLRTTVHDDRCEKCEYEVSQFNPAFWNRPEVQPRNNCYNYGRNWRTDTFAQPGRAHGAGTSTMACGTVTTAAMADGLKKRCNCLPASEYPRRLMALVIDPGWDYHWYRHQRGGFWGHKPGQTAARNYDNSNNVIANPETCDRGGYTDFCDYFYAGRSVVIN